MWSKWQEVKSLAERVKAPFCFWSGVDESADALWIWLQRYSVAVYLVRVFTAADLFSQLKLCSVESAERCRERSKFQLLTAAPQMSHDHDRCVCAACSPRQTTIWSRERNCDNGPPSLPHLSSEYSLVFPASRGGKGTSVSSCLFKAHFLCLPLCLPAGEDAARCTVSSPDLRPPSVFRRSLFPADEREEAHMDLPRLWQARSLWAAHHRWVRSFRARSDFFRLHFCQGWSILSSPKSTHSVFTLLRIPQNALHSWRGCLSGL